MTSLKTHPRSLALLLSLAGLVALPPAIAADAQQSAAPKATAPATHGALARDARASQILGKDVRDAAGQKIGEIKDLIVDMGSGHLQYAVLDFGGVLGVGDKLFAYPVNAFRTSTTTDDLVLNVDKERLRNAPGFDKSHWPGLDKDAYWRDVDRYHGAAGRAAEPTGTHHWMRASDLIGKDIDDRQGKDAGEVKDLVVNMAQQRVHYVVMDYDMKGTPDDKLLAVPLATLGMPADKDKDLVLRVPREQLDTKHAFNDKAWPDLNDPAYRRDVGTWLDHYPATSRAQEKGR
jgi:sporulation protein YlmC with PRC-barrel domain